MFTSLCWQEIEGSNAVSTSVYQNMHLVAVEISIRLRALKIFQYLTISCNRLDEEAVYYGCNGSQKATVSIASWINSFLDQQKKEKYKISLHFNILSREPLACPLFCFYYCFITFSVLCEDHNLFSLWSPKSFFSRDHTFFLEITK